MKQLLATMTPQQRHDESQAACQRVINLDEFKHASVVMLYMPLQHELDLTPLALKCFQSGKMVCVPKVDWKSRDMTPIEASGFDDETMDVDARGLRSPRDGQIVPPTMLDLVVVPGQAFDTSGRRLGRGGGYYDRFLSRLRRSTTTVGLAFDRQVIDGVPFERGDVMVDILVTDRRVSYAAHSRSSR
jgi:5-formyltetrahydrofolate cyclo-ligase